MLADKIVVGATFGTLHCTLLDRRSSIPLAGARATCVWRNERVTALDADTHGVFTIQLPEGVYDFVASAPGEGQPLHGEPSTAIAGYVRDRVGLPVPNAAIYITGENSSASYTTSSDGSGAYVVHGVVPAMYDVSVRSGDRTLAHEHVPIAHVKSLVRHDIRITPL